MAVASFAAAEDQQARLQSEMDTRALNRAVEWLRPFVETMGWEYVVVWKIADDPSRYGNAMHASDGQSVQSDEFFDWKQSMAVRVFTRIFPEFH